MNSITKLLIKILFFHLFISCNDLDGKYLYEDGYIKDSLLIENGKYKRKVFDTNEKRYILINQGKFDVKNSSLCFENMVSEHNFNFYKSLASKKTFFIGNDIDSEVCLEYGYYWFEFKILFHPDLTDEFYKKID